MKRTGKKELPTFLRVLFMVLGLLSVFLGVLGIFLPLLPTTPFLLLALYLFVRSSERLHGWLMGHPILGRYLQSYIRERAVPRSVKRYTIALLWSSMLLSTLLLQPELWVCILLLAIAIGVTIHVAGLRSM